MKTTRVKGIRLSNEVADFYDDLPIRSILENLKGQIERGEVSINGGIISVNTLSDSVNTAEIKERQSKIVEFNSVNTLQKVVNGYEEKVEDEHATICLSEYANAICGLLEENDIDDNQFHKMLYDLLSNGNLILKDGKLDIAQTGKNKLDGLSYDEFALVQQIVEMIKKTRGADRNYIDAVACMKDFKDKLESGEYDLSSGKLKLGYHEVFEVLNKPKIRECLKSVWDACREKGKPYTLGLEKVFEVGAKEVASGIAKDQQGGSEC